MNIFFSLVHSTCDSAKKNWNLLFNSINAMESICHDSAALKPLIHNCQDSVNHFASNSWRFLFFLVMWMDVPHTITVHCIPIQVKNKSMDDFYWIEMFYRCKKPEVCLQNGDEWWNSWSSVWFIYQSCFKLGELHFHERNGSNFVRVNNQL